MTAVAAPYDDVLADEVLSRALVERLDEECLVSLLVYRLRSFLALGYTEAEALLLAVGFSPRDTAFIADSLTSGSLVLH